MDKVLNEVLDRITPSKAEKDREFEIIGRVLEILREFPVDPIVVGSTIKETDLAGDKDIDIFMRFDPETSRQDLEGKGIEYGKAVFEKLGVKWRLDFSEHPYTKGEY
ncbi:MAG TPA: hypothetical protein ENN13_01040, partial [Candidatus Altiarchaeales archaeon]|nr:hypothetical protein [Candidatus Altiarchaeales archaeon]